NTQFVTALNIGTTNGYATAASCVQLQDDASFVGVVFTVTSGPTLPAGCGSVTNGAAAGDGSLIECFYATTPVSYGTPMLAVEALQRAATVYRNYLPFSYAGEIRTYKTRQIPIDGPYLYVWFTITTNCSA